MEAKFTVAVPADKPLPAEKVTRISWLDLVDLIATHEISIADTIRHDNPSADGGTEHLTGAEMLRLWKEVEHKKFEKASVGV
jgi:hypothetical protein